MAWIRKGKHAGEQVTIRQYCNDWFSVDGLPPQESIIRPTNIVLTMSEFRQVHDNELTGTLFQQFEPTIGKYGVTFKRRGL